MDLKEIMRQRTFVIVGNTLDTEKYACKIKYAMLENGYTVHSVGKELASINDVEDEIDVLDLCIHPAKGIKLLEECKKSVKAVVIQPGAESDEIKEFLKANNIAFIEGCLLLGLKLYK